MSLLKRMHLHTRRLILTAVGILAFLLLCPAVPANTTLEITNVYNGSYIDINGDNTVPGPYLATIGGAQILVYCLDLHISPPVGTAFGGYLTRPDTSAEDEAAFLADRVGFFGRSIARTGSQPFTHLTA